jgi:uncharacterized membrane protein
MDVLNRYRRVRADDGYLNKLAMILPVVLVAGYTGVNSIIGGANDITSSTRLYLLWIIFALFIAVTAIYLFYKNNKLTVSTEKMTTLQIVLTVVSFIVWSLAIGGILRTTYPDAWKQTYEDLLVALWTFLAPLALDLEK